MITVGDIYQEINHFAPFSTAMDFDNPGLLVGDESQNVQRVMLALDITSWVVEEAENFRAELIVSHHPVIFHPLRSLGSNDIPYLLARKGIAAICAHTNLDMADGGVNTCLSHCLGLKQIKMLKEYKQSGLPEGLIGETAQEYTPAEFAAMVKQVLGCGGLKYVDGGRPIRTVALCSGAGGDLLFDAIHAGADAFVTADTKHHELLAAKESSITLVDAGHFCTEDVVIPAMIERLSRRFPEVTFQKSKSMRDPALYL